MLEHLTDSQKLHFLFLVSVGALFGIIGLIGLAYAFFKWLQIRSDHRTEQMLVRERIEHNEALKQQVHSQYEVNALLRARLFDLERNRKNGTI